MVVLSGKRYYPVGHGVNILANQYYVDIPLPVTMRTTPIVYLPQSFLINKNTNLLNITRTSMDSFKSCRVNPNSIALDLYCNESFSDEGVVQVLCENNNPWIIDANL